MGSISNNYETYLDRSSQICRSTLILSYIECLPRPSRAKYGHFPTQLLSLSRSVTLIAPLFETSAEI